MDHLDPRFEQFIQEQKYLANVSDRTIEWYRASLKWLSSPSPDPSQLKDCVMQMRAKNLKATSVNCYGRAINSYLRWSGSTHKIPKLKEECRIMDTFLPADIRKFLAWKPKGFYRTRLHCLVLTLADTGCRISEALELRWSDVDFDNLLLKLHGKGRKDRVIPFSTELRRHLWRWQASRVCDLVFSGRRGQFLDRRVVLRDVKRLCRDLGIVVPSRTLHAFRYQLCA